MDDKSGSDGQISSCKVVKILGSESNIHGISKIARAQSTPRRIFWIILVVLAFSFAMFQMVSVLQKYLEYPTTEVVTKSQKIHVAFPAVTLCNINPISMTKTNQMITNSTDMIAWFQFLEAANFSDEERTKLQSNQAFYENLPDTAENIAYSFDELVLGCQFNNDECGIQNFSPHFNGKNYYNCFTFTVNTTQMQETGKQIQQNKAGIDHGLSLILSLGERTLPPGSYGIYDIKNPSAFGLGIRAQIHTSNARPTPFYHGFDVSPGFSTSVRLTASVHSSIPPPYGDCSKENDKDGQMYKDTMFNCLQRCQQKTLINKCGCKTSALPDILNSKAPYCLSIKNWRSQPDLYKDNVHLEMAECEKKVMDEINNDRHYEDQCQCSEPCERTTYNQLMSMSYWPDEFYQFSFLNTWYKKSRQSSGTVEEAFNTLNTIVQKYGNYASQGMTVNYDINDQIELERASKIIRQNFMRLNVYFQDLRVTEYTQIPAYNLTSLLSDIGITLILWLGFSMLSFMEVLELIMALVMHVCKSHSYLMGNKSG